MSSKQDLRKTRTEYLINNAFSDLLKEKGSFSSITIKDITDKAMINRSTFYAHYLDKYDLLDKYASSIFTHIEQLPTITYENQSNKSIEKQLNTLFTQLFEHVATYSAFYKIMLHELPETRLKFEKFLETIMSDRLEKAKKQANPQSTINAELRISEYYPCYLTGALLGVLTKWLENDMMYSPQYMGHIFNKIISVNFYDLSK